MVGRVACAGVLGLMIAILALLPTPALAQARYQCSGGVPILVNYGGQHAEITFPGIRYFLPQVPLAEGSRYSDGRFTWTVTRDQEGTLTHDGAVVARGCRTTVSSPIIGVLTGTTYSCAGGLTVSAAYAGSTAILTFLGSTHRLVQVPLYEGSRYTDGRFTWTLSRNQEGTLIHDGATIARECRTASSQPIGTQIAGSTYTCAGGGTVVATYNGSIATVMFQGNTYRLVQVPLVEGSRYTDGRFTWTVSRGAEATLTRFGAVLARECRTEAPRQIEPER